MKTEERIQAILEKEPTSRVDVETQLNRDGISPSQYSDLLDAVDWNNEALKALRFGATQSETALNEVPDFFDSLLRSKGFTRDQTAKAIAAYDWSDRIDSLVKSMALLRPESTVRSCLSISGFSDEIIEAAFARAQIDWAQLVQDEVRKLLDVGLSRKELYREMEELDYTRSEIRSAVRALHVDWYQQALRRANIMSSYLGSMGHIDDRLMEAGFTGPEVAFALDNVVFEPMTSVYTAFDTYMREEGISAPDLFETLRTFGFDEAALQLIIDEVETQNIDWREAAVEPIRQSFKMNTTFNAGEMEEALLAAGYSKEQIRHAFSVIKPDWAKRAFAYIVQENDDFILPAPQVLMRQMMSRGISKKDAESTLRNAHVELDDYAAGLYAARLYGRRHASEQDHRYKLTELGFSQETIEKVMQALHYDWQDEANMRAEFLKEAVSNSGASEKAFAQVLEESAGFPAAIAEKAAASIEIDWVKNAVQDVHDLIDDGWGKRNIPQHLETDGFTSSEIDKALEIVNLHEMDWNMYAHTALQKLLPSYCNDLSTLKEIMQELGYTDDQITNAAHAEGVVL